jgi:DNA helicase II / ATP-dependent DNA helicase PcrA
MNEVVESDERAHLERVKAKLGEALVRLESRVVHYAAEAREQAAHMWEHRRDMDHIEKAVVRETQQQIVATGEVVAATRKRVQKLLASPYFGRFDFQGAGEQSPRPVYVGVHAFADPGSGAPLVFDWRAPISTMFYDYELGEARYDSPLGRVSGEIVLKRQFRIRRGRMEFMLESGLNILDDVLQEELSRTSDERMKNIVATIQRDQNAIIRTEDAPVLIIQGVAGSGKTSVALHRIAFLLYRHRDTLSSQDILIVSPNKVFADFIADVLPELGEEQIPEIEFERLAHELLEHKIEFQTLSEQTTLLLETRDEALQRRIEDKASFEFLEKLEAYADHVDAARFRAADLEVGSYTVRARLLEQAYRKRADLRPAERLKWVADWVVQHVRGAHRYDLTARERTELRARVKKMCTSTPLRSTYKKFFEWLGRPELLKSIGRSKLEYSDVFPMIYLKLRLEGVQGSHQRVKHLVIDEMQDYTPVQYAVISRLFSCDKTLLGDMNQAVHASTGSTAETISKVFKQAECVKLCKSYRSSYEITRFAQGVSPDADLLAIERHDEKPIVLAHATEAEEIGSIIQAIDAFRERNARTLGILCKSQTRAARLHDRLLASGAAIELLTAGSTAFVPGVVVCSAHLAKGLEFDEVLVPQATDENYATALDRNLLYVACTRAMHRLVLTHTGAVTSFLPDPSLYERRPPAGGA